MSQTMFDVLLGAIFLAQLVGFSLFYKSSQGRVAIYYSWYAHIIDVLGIASGVFLTTLAVLIHHNPYLFTVAIPKTIVFVLFLIGSWQATIHGVKWAVRTVSAKR